MDFVFVCTAATAVLAAATATIFTLLLAQH